VAPSIRTSWQHFAEKRRSLGRYSSLADSDHGVFFFYIYKHKYSCNTGIRQGNLTVSRLALIYKPSYFLAGSCNYLQLLKLFILKHFSVLKIVLFNIEIVVMGRKCELVRDLKLLAVTIYKFSINRTINSNLMSGH
jgi:hypothetical protein